MARVIHWALLALAACAAVHAQDAPTEDAGACVEPSLLSGLEAQVTALEDAKAALTLQLDADAVAWAEQKQQCDAETAALSTDKQRLEVEAAACAESKQTLMAQTAKEHEEIVSKLLLQIDSLKSTVQALEKEVERLDAAATTRGEEARAAQATLAKANGQIAKLEKEVQASRKKNDKLRGELEQAKGVEVTLAALLSSYYDEGVELAEQAAEIAREQLESSSGTFEQARASIESATTSVGEVTSKFYAENLAATVDPVLADVHAAMEPHVQKYAPLVQAEAARAQEQVVAYSKQTLQHAKTARLEAIALLEENEHVAVHAQKVVDGLLLALLLPLVYIQLRLALRLLWWSVRTSVCISTCGLCCRGRGKKSKRKASKKMMASLTSPTPTAAVSKTTKTSTTATTSKRNTRKNK
jgi:predicted  nucleic acid-binding Zn-ribbon protein